MFSTLLNLSEVHFVENLKILWQNVDSESYSTVMNSANSNSIIKRLGKIDGDDMPIYNTKKEYVSLMDVVYDIYTANDKLMKATIKGAKISEMRQMFKTSIDETIKKYTLSLGMVKEINRFVLSNLI